MRIGEHKRTVPNLKNKQKSMPKYEWLLKQIEVIGPTHPKSYLYFM